MVGEHLEYIEMGGSALPPLVPFQDIFPLPVADDGDDVHGISISVLTSFRSKRWFCKYY